MELLLKTQELLRNRPQHVTLEQLAKELDVSVAWLTKFAASKIDGPSVKTVEKLYNILSDEKLKV